MKTLLFSIMLSGVISSYAQVGIGTATPKGSAMLDVSSTTKGFLPPRMTALQRDNILSPDTGLVIWCRNCGPYGEVQVFNGTKWMNVSGDSALVVVNIPSATLQYINNVTLTTATGESQYSGRFVTDFGICWSANPNPTKEDSKAVDIQDGHHILLTGLTTGTTYYARAYATNPRGTGYSDQISFTTSIADIEGNVYKVVTIGTQVWMKENLKTTLFNNGIGIPNVPDNSAWYALSTPGYCWYSNDASTYKATIGALYNWYTVNTGNLCPSGWHVPTDDEWTVLTDFLGGVNVAGDKMKATGTTYWVSPNSAATDEAGYNALGGGFRYPYGNYADFTWDANWFSSTENTSSDVWARKLFYYNGAVLRDSNSKKIGFSVRCIKN